jgi:PAS domain S-box-containing protein
MSRMRRKFIGLKQWFLSGKNPDRLVARIVSSISISIGCLVLIGWIWDISFLKSVVPGSATMKVNTAICFILTGISLGLQTRKRRDAFTTRLALGCASAVSIVGLLNLCQYLFNWNLGIDELLFRDIPISADTVYPGRMGDNTALNFSLTGLALYLNGKRTRRSYYVAQSAIFIVAAIALLAVVGYIYNVQIFYQFIFYSASMAIHTALTFLVLCIGILLLQKDGGWMQIVTSNYLGGIIARQLIPAAIGIPLILGWLIRLGKLAGWYDSNFGLALMVISLIVILLGLIGRSAAIINSIEGDRQRATDRLLSNKELLELALQGAGQGIWDWNLNTKILTWDDRCKEIFGLPPNFPVTYEWHLEALHPDDRERVSEARAIALRDRTEFNEEYRTFHPDGTMRWILARGLGYYDGKGEPERMSGTVMDISDRKQAQLNDRFLHELDLRLRQLSDAKAMQWEVVSSLGEYLKVDRAIWLDIEWENRLITIDRDWRQEGLPSHEGTYSLSNFIASELQFAHAAGETIVFSDVTTDPNSASYVNNYQQLGIGAMVAVPCIQEGRWVAILTVNVRNPRKWRDDEVNLLQTTVARLWSIIEQTEAVQALQESEERLRLALKATEQGLYDLNVQTGEAKVNPEYALMLGYAPETFRETSAKWLDRLHPEEREFISKVYQEYIAGDRGEYRVEFRQRTQSGDWKWILSIGKIVAWDAEGKPLRMIGTHINITARKRFEADLQERSEHIQLLYETTRDLLSTSHPLTLVENLFAKLKSLIGLDIYLNFLIDEEQQKLHLAFYNGISDETARSIEWLELGQAVCGTVAQQRCQMVQTNLQDSTDPKTELVRSIGLTAYSCQPLIAQGKLFGTLSFGSRTQNNFTPAQTNLFQAICDQIAIALERSEILSSLQQQTEELIKANRLKDEFLAALSHELRTPLNPILGWTKLLQSQKLTDIKTKEALATIERNVKQQIALVDDLLDLSRVVQGQFKLISQPVDLVPIINAAIDTVRFAATAKSIALEFHFLSHSASRIMGDEIRLQQIFWNLLANAIKFTPDRGRIEVHLEEVQNQAQISFTDTGIGISGEFLPYVFDRFRQADGSSTRRYGGLGLGLALVKHLVELHGGTVKAESFGEGKGATFRVNLPLLQETPFNFSEQSNLHRSPTNLSRSFPSGSLSGIRVLIVDDEPDNLELLEFILTQEGAIVTAITSVTEVLAIFSENPPDILISDIGMPEMSGYGLLQQIRALPSQQNNPINAIALTAFAQQEDREKAIAAGFQAYFSKPINPSELITAIATFK